MKSKLPNRKCRSPQIQRQNQEEIELDKKENNQMPNGFVIIKRRDRLARADLSNTKAFFGRTSRSKSPNEIDPAEIVFGHKKCRKSKKSPPKTSRQELDKAIPEPYKENKNGSPSEYIKILKRRKSPELLIRPTEENKDPKNNKELNDLIKKKKELNEALWEAAEEGDTSKITKLLEW